MHLTTRTRLAGAAATMALAGLVLLPTASSDAAAPTARTAHHHAEPGDDHGKHGEPGDDHGKHGEPGDDHGRHAEPGDDHGRRAEPGDDHGKHGGHDD